MAYFTTAAKIDRLALKTNTIRIIATKKMRTKTHDISLKKMQNKDYEIILKPIFLAKDPEQNKSKKMILHFENFKFDLFMNNLYEVDSKEFERIINELFEVNFFLVDNKIFKKEVISKFPKEDVYQIVEMYFKSNQTFKAKDFIKILQAIATFAYQSVGVKSNDVLGIDIVWDDDKKDENNVNQFELITSVKENSLSPEIKTANKRSKKLYFQDKNNPTKKAKKEINYIFKTYGLYQDGMLQFSETGEFEE